MFYAKRVSATTFVHINSWRNRYSFCLMKYLVMDISHDTFSSIADRIDTILFCWVIVGNITGKWSKSFFCILGKPDPIRSAMIFSSCHLRK